MNKFDVKKFKSFLAESWAVCWPMTLIMFFEFLIGIVDVYIAGKISKEVQAAYGFVFQLYFVLTIIGASFTVGSVSVISKLFASSRKQDLSTAVSSSLATTLFFGMFLCLLGAIFGQKALDIFNVPGQIKEMGKSLLVIYTAGILFHYPLINSNGILRSCGRIRQSLVTMSIVCILNVIMNFYFVFHTALGYKGIAVSTAVSVFAGAAINMFFVRQLITRGKKVSLDIVKKIVHIGWPMGVLQIAWQGGVLLIYLILSMLPENSIEILAAFTNGQRIESAIFLPAFAFNMANAVIVGNLLGKKSSGDAFKNGLVTAVSGVFIIAALALLVIMNAGFFMAILSKDPIVVKYGVRYLYIVLISEPFMALSVILGGGLSGAGDTKTVMKIVALSVWLVRIPLGFFLGIVFGLGSAGVWWAMNVSIFVQSVFMAKRYLSKKWIRYA